MSQHPATTADLAGQRRRDMVARAEAHRIARAARAGYPKPARPMRFIQLLIAEARRPVARLLQAKTPMLQEHGSER